MSEDLKPGVRHTVSTEDLEAVWNFLGDSIPLGPSSPDAPFNPLPLGSSLLFGFMRLRPREAGTGQGLSLPPLNTSDPHAFMATPQPIYRMQPMYATALHTGLFNER